MSKKRKKNKKFPFPLIEADVAPIKEAAGIKPFNDNVNFKIELTKLINKYSLENPSNTPDFILAQHLCDCLAIFNATAFQRSTWYSGN